MIKALFAGVVLLVIFASKASFGGRVVAVGLAIALLFFAFKNKNKF